MPVLFVLYPLFFVCIYISYQVRAGYDKHGEVFTMQVAHKRMTFMVGRAAQTVYFGCKDSQLSQREVYAFTVPVFGANIVYDAPYPRMYEQLKFLRHGMSGNAMRTHCHKIIAETNLFFKNFAAEGECDLYTVLSELIINTASRCLLGKEVREQMHNETAVLYGQLSDGMKHISFAFPNLPTEFHRKRDEARVRMIEIFTEGIRKRKANNAKNEYEDDLLQGLIDAKYLDGSKPTDDEIGGLLIAMLFAGQHTSNITSTWVGYRLMTAGGDLVPRLLEEQKQALQETDGKLTYESLENMTLLHDCIKETLRMYPPLIVLMRLAVKPVKYKNITIPVGDTVCVATPVSNRLEEVYTNPNTFDPDRWARGEGKQSNSFISFGGGRHQCLGQDFGIMQIKCIWSTILRQFDMENIDPLPDIDYSSIVAGFPHDQKCTKVRFKRRKTPIGTFD